jgi:hypothetical protein
VYNLIMGEKKSWRAVLRVKLVDGLLLTAMVLWFCREIILDGRVPFFRDLGSYFYPMRFVLYQSFWDREIPLWTSHFSMGFPFLANPQAGVFYPPHALFLFPPFFTAIRLIFVFHFAVAASGSYLVFRRWTGSRWLALTGAALFTFSGVLVSLSNVLDHFQSAVWLPWIVLLNERCLRDRSLKNFAALTLALLIQWLAGSPEIYAMTSGVLLLNGLRLKVEDDKVTLPAVLGVLLSSNALVVGIASVQILPSAELFLHSWRARTIPPEQAMMWSLNPSRLLNLFFLDKEVNLYAPQGLHLFFSREPPLILSLYLGAFAVSGICLWLVHSSPRERIVTLILLLVVLILAMGQHTPIYPGLLRGFPLMGIIRFPEKLSFMAVVVIQWMVLMGIARFLQPDRSFHWKDALALSLPLVGLCLIYVALRLNLSGLIQWVASARQSVVHEVATMRIATSVLVNLERQMVLILGIGLVLGLSKAGKLKVTLAGSLLFALTCVDLLSAHRGYLFALDPVSVYGRPQILAVPQENSYRLFYTRDLSNLDPDSYSFTNRPFPEMVSSMVATLIPNTGVFRGFEYAQEMESLARIPYLLFLQVASRLAPEDFFRLLGVLNVKYLASSQSLPQHGIIPLRHLPEYPLWLYEVESVVPRVYVVQRITVETDPKRTLERLGASQFHPLEEVILEKAAPVQRVENFQGEAKISRYRNQWVTIDASLNSQGILVLADSFYPGWDAYVDGQKAEILRANYFFRGVLVPSGKHRVEFRYAPYSFKAGATISLLTLSFLSVLVLARRKSGL